MKKDIPIVFALVLLVAVFIMGTDFQTVDEYYGFINEFPESAYRKEAEGYLKKSQKALAGQPIDED